MTCIGDRAYPLRTLPDGSKAFVFPFVIHDRKQPGDFQPVLVFRKTYIRDAFYKFMMPAPLVSSDTGAWPVCEHVTIADLMCAYHLSLDNTVVENLPKCENPKRKLCKHTDWVTNTMMHEVKAWLDAELNAAVKNTRDKFVSLTALNRIARAASDRSMMYEIYDLAHYVAQWRLRQLCAARIQRRFREAVTNPSHPMCRRRLLREFQDMGPVCAGV